MRLFAALLPPDDALAALAAATARVTALPGADRLRWTARDGWHVTLAFYGEVPEPVVADLSARLERAAGRAHPLHLRLGGGGHFGETALWTGVHGDPGERTGLAHLAGAAQAAGRRAGLPTEDGGHYRPHLTLARARRGTRIRRYAEALEGFAGAEWTASELTLVRSHLPGGGHPGERPRYEAVAAWPLGGS